MFAKLITIPPLLLLTLFWLVPLFLLIMALWLRRRQLRPEITAVTRFKRAGQYLRANMLWLLVLAVSGFLALIVIGLTVVSYRESAHHTEPFPYQVTLPEDATLPIEALHFTGGDDLSLAAWYVPPQNGAMIILLHGFGGNRSDMIWHAEKLVDAGFGVLLYDARGTAESEGAYRSLGWEDPADVAAAVAFLSQRPDVNPEHIGIVGCSIGGQIALRSAADLPEINAVWADGPAPARAADYAGMDYWLNDLFMLITHFTDGITARRLGIAPPPPTSAVVDAIAPRPLMLLAGGENGFETSQIENYARLAGSNADVWLVPGGSHCDGHEVQPDEYADRMIDFFKAAFALDEGSS